MKIFIYILLLFCLSACFHISDKELELALQLSGKNRTELEAVLNHYKNDTLKFKAACYLIRNMPYHYSRKEYYLSPDGEKYRPDITAFSNKEEVKKHCDSLMRCGYRIERQNISDIASLDSAYLVNNIDLAFFAWQKPWAKNISFNDFCKYILPYRAQTEQISFLRGKLMTQFMPILDSIQPTSPLEACTLLNVRLKKIIRYQDTGLPLYPTIDETYQIGISQCDGICNLGAFIMRAVGIPVAVDFTIWPKMDLGHSWCAVLDNGHFYSFGPGEDQPNVHAKLFSKIRHRRPAKVYRFSFNPIQYGKKTKNDGFNTFLKSPLLHDVTNEYLNKTTNIEISVDTEDNTRNKEVYLCTHNFYQWQPLAIGTRYNNNVCYFKNVVGDNIFIVADCPDGKNLRYISAPFYLNKKGNIHLFIPQIEQKQTVILEKRKDKKKVNHTLFYWNIIEKRFIPLSYKESTDTTQMYDQVPKNALLWFTIPEHIFNQRIFYLENDSLKKY